MLIAELIDTVFSLTLILEEESERLTAPRRRDDLGELAVAKGRLVAALETQIAQLERQQPDWMAELAPDARDQLSQAVRALNEASVVNADVLRRQIELSTEMMAVVAAEVQRLTGTSSATYGANGGLFQVDQATPIALNARC